MVVEARGSDEYRSCSSVRVSEATGCVAYTGICRKSGKCLQQCAYAATCAGVACVRRMRDRVGMCLDDSQSVVQTCS